MANLCFECAVQSSTGNPLINLDDKPYVPVIPELVDGICPVCGGTRALDSEDVDG